MKLNHSNIIPLSVLMGVALSLAACNQSSDAQASPPQGASSTQSPDDEPKNDVDPSDEASPAPVIEIPGSPIVDLPPAPPEAVAPPIELPPVVVAPVRPVTPPATSVQPTSFQSEVYSQTNAYRAQNGLTPFATNPALTLAAQRYAEDMAQRGFFDHVSPEGGTVGDRIVAAGYAGARSWGENIAYGYRDSSAVMEGWIGSAGHRENLLRTIFKEIGVGFAIAKDGTPYWVQDFASR